MRKIYALTCFFLSNICLFAQDVTLENLMAAPFYSQITVSPSGNKVAWVKNERGVRNIEMAEIPAYSVQALTDYKGDIGVDISNLEWSKDESKLYFVRGNAPQLRATQPHNPAHLLESTAPMIWQLSLPSAQVKTPLQGLTAIGNGGSPSVSPDGSKLIFARGGQFYVKNLSSDTAQARQLFQARGGQSSPIWSPDGSKLAFVSNRGEYSFVGVYDFNKKDYLFMTPSVDRDNEPVWSPDGKQIAFLRIPRNVEPNVIFFPVHEQQAWSIMIADVETGKAKTLFTADKGMGSAYWNHNGAQQLYWTKNGKITFVWEKTGWLQLYSATVATGKIEPLTEGAFEIDEVHMSNDRRMVYFNSNQNDIDRKHIWVLDAESEALSGKHWSQPIQITDGKAVEALFKIDRSGDIYFIQTDGRTPTQIGKAERPMTKGKMWERRILTPLSASFPRNMLVEPAHLPLKAADGFTFYNQIFYPQNLKNDKSHPALIFVHGGSRRQMLLGYHPSWYYANAYHLSQYFAAKGYVVVHINYRSGIGYGMHFREAENYGASGNSEFRDLEALGEYLKQHPSVDGSKIAVWGGSYGGYMTAMALARRSDLFAVGGDLHGVHNWNTEIPTFMPAYDSLRFPKHGQSAYKSSPVYFVDGWKSPVIFVHGDDDQNVPFSETVHIQRVLRAKGVEFESVVIPDEVHSMLRWQSWMMAYEGIAEFIERKLKK